MESRRGVLWQPEEISLMLDLVLNSKDVGLLMRSTHLPTKRAYNRIAREMAARGYHRTGLQINSKFKTLKAKFLASLHAWQGMPPERGQIRYHEELVAIWERAGRPRWEDRHHDGKCAGDGVGNGQDTCATHCCIS